MRGAGVFKALCLVTILVISGIECVQSASAGPCGKASPEKVALQLAPCVQAATDPTAKVPASCCSKISAILGTNPRCLCAVLTSATAKKAGVKLNVAKNIPRKCHLKTPRGASC